MVEFPDRLTPLTLEQVKQAARFAWHESGSMWVAGMGFALGTEDRPWFVKRVDWTWDSCPFDDGWHHLLGCDCEFCRPEPTANLADGAAAAIAPQA